MGSKKPYMQMKDLSRVFSFMLVFVNTAIFLAIYSRAPLYVGTMVKGDSCFVLLDADYFLAGFVIFSVSLFFQYFALGAYISGAGNHRWPRVTCLLAAVLLLLGLTVTLSVNCVFPAFFESFQTTEP
jgi:Na+-driven multidrug efflux pump